MNKIKTDHQYIRVVTQAACSFVNFLRGLLSKDQDEDEATEILIPYAKDLLDTLSQLFSQLRIKLLLSVENPLILKAFSYQ